jgi:hypothetical protein
MMGFCSLCGAVVNMEIIRCDVCGAEAGLHPPVLTPQDEDFDDELLDMDIDFEDY